MKQIFCDQASITSGLLHLWGAFMAIGGTVLLILKAKGALPPSTASFIYGITLIGLFTASSIFHIFYIS